jgi:hypothetical protein
MSDPIGLAGTIETWVAVFLALAALAGILPAYFLYKRSRTKRVQALALVDDPSHTFVSGGIRLPGIRLNQKIKVPDLFNPPRLQSLVSLPDPGRLGQHRSTTNWVNFAHVMMATFPSLKIIPGKKWSHLAFAGAQSHLRVHRSWILLLGVLHRYAFRPDYGLPLGASTDADMEARGFKNCLSGLSGMLFRVGDEYYEDSPVFYEMHTIPQLQQCLRQETVDIRTLILLFLGYIQMPNGEYLSARVPAQSHSHLPGAGPTTFAGRLQIIKIHNGDVPRIHTRLLRELDLLITTIKVLRLVLPYDIFGRVLPPHLDSKMMEERGFCDIGSWKPYGEEHVANVWMSRKDIHRIVSCYFSTPLSPNGIFYDTLMDDIVKRVFKTKELRKTLELAERWLSKLDVRDEERLTVRVALDAVTEADTAEVSWSRHAMQTFYALEEAIQRIWKRITGNQCPSAFSTKSMTCSELL